MLTFALPLRQFELLNVWVQYVVVAHVAYRKNSQRLMIFRDLQQGGNFCSIKSAHLMNVQPFVCGLNGQVSNGLPNIVAIP